ncbi:MAG: glycosyltransferase family 4 protein [Bacteroidota bacterium]|nr:glycosyltransferase family 4 protein [Bacteroidota bacterium]
MYTILYLGNKLSRHGFTPTSIETLGPLLESEGYDVLYASEKKSQWKRFVDMGINIIRNRNKIDYILIDTYSTHSFWYALMGSQLSRLFRIKYIPILHGGNLPYRLDKNPKLSKMIFNHAYINVAPSGYLMDAFQKHNYPNLKFIPNTIEIDNYHFLERSNITTPKLLWVRSFADLYNPSMAIDVLKKIQEKYPDASLCMVGPDKDGSMLRTKEYAKKLNLINVSFTGKLSKKEWTDLSKEYNIFINTTNFDNTPVSVIEAMCLGIPVVSTNVGGIPFLLTNNNNALLVEKEDTQAMVKAVETLVENTELRKQLTTNGYNLVKTFDWNSVRNLWKEILR